MNIERVRSYLTTNPTAYAGLRALDVSTQGREQSVAEGDEIPFIFSVVFIPMIIAYTLLKRVIYRFKRGLSREKLEPDPPSDHLFVMTSTHKYRTYAFEEIGTQLREKNRDVMFLCSPSAADQMTDWQQDGFQTESFRDLLRFVSPYELFVNLVRSVVTMYKLRRITSGEFQEASLVYAFNSTFLEYTKFSSLEPLVRDDPAVHTYSLMPYQARATVSDRLYVYQHGAQFSSDEDAWSAISFFPATLFLWGEAWVVNFEPKLHPETMIRIVGSPWHDHISKSKDASIAEWDVLFISGSQVISHSEERELLYEELVTGVINACEEAGWSLAIKLHPAENGDWYRQHGWEQYIVEFESIQDGLNSVNVAVTHYSSAFVESIMTGTPIILSEAFSDGLNEIRPIEGAYFVNHDEIKKELDQLLESDIDTKKIIKHNNLVTNDDSINQILDKIINKNNK